MCTHLSSSLSMQYSMWRTKRCTVFCILLLWSCLFLPSHCQTNVEWTPNEKGGAGPLPQSQNQREQLLQLEQAIMNSPDPSATLHQVAEANNMDPRDLAEMLDRNRREMQGVAGHVASPGNSLPRKILKLIGSIVAVVLQSAKKNPRSFGLVATTMSLLLYVLLNAPRNGMVLSTRRGLLSKGHSTVWNPPTPYVHRLLENTSQLSRRSLSLPLENKGIDLHVQDPEHDGVEWHKLGRKSDMVQAVSAQVTIDVNDLLPDDVDDEEEEEGEAESGNGGPVSKRSEMSEMVFDAAATVMSSRRLSDFVDTPKSLRFQSNDEGRLRYAYLVVKKMGDWGRFGLQPLKVSHQQENEHQSKLVYSTLRGSHFDAEIAISVKLDPQNYKLVVTTSLAVPKKGKKLKKQLASLIVSTLAQSVARSTTTHVRQTLARQSQSSRYRSKARNRATEKRHERFENEKKMEEMARERKRKWQRRNLDSGRYRPSGKRMQSPNNC